MTREEELELLVAEQRKDDTHVVRDPHPGLSFTSLDAEVGHAEHNGGLPAIREDYLVGEVYDFEAMIESGDYEAQGEIVGFPPRAASRGYNLRQIEHGTYNGYHNQGCRCPRCTRAHTVYIVALQRKARRREQNARPDRVCACGAKFRPVPSTKQYCSKRCVWRFAKQRERAAA